MPPPAPRFEIQHPCLRDPRPSSPLEAVVMNDRQRVGILLEACALDAHLAGVGLRPTRAWEGARVSPQGRLVAVAIDVAPDRQPAIAVAGQRAFDDDPESVLRGDGDGIPSAVVPASESPRPVWRILKEAGIAPSTSEARRLIDQGGVEVNGKRVVGLAETLPPGRYAVKVGKRRVYRVIVEG